jgi:hypothetical protein
VNKIETNVKIIGLPYILEEFINSIFLIFVWERKGWIKRGLDLD